MILSNEKVTIFRGGESHWVGNGFPVCSVFGYNDLGQELSPFLLLDYAAPYEFSPSLERRGVGGHPHRGFETVTIVYQGELEHRDSSGGGGKIGPGDVQWMTAASGLIHEEFHSEEFTRKGGTFQVIQLWVNLPAKYKSADPAYQTLLKVNIPTVKLINGEARIIAGELFDKKGPARTFTSINLWDVNVATSENFRLPLPIGHTKAILLLDGEIEVDKKMAKSGELLIIAREEQGVELISHGSAHLLVMTGEPIDEPIVGYGPFVMNSEAEIKQAFTDYKQGKLGAL